MQKFPARLRAFFAARPDGRNCIQASMQILHAGLKVNSAFRADCGFCIQASRQKLHAGAGQRARLVLGVSYIHDSLIRSLCLFSENRQTAKLQSTSRKTQSSPFFAFFLLMAKQAIFPGKSMFFFSLYYSLCSCFALPWRSLRLCGHIALPLRSVADGAVVRENAKRGIIR
jgi:hypothetical protein